MKRTMYAGQVSEEQIGQTVTLDGWVQKRRDLGSLIFIDLRDREGIVQLTFNEDFSEAREIADQARNEYVLQVTGEVVARDQAQINSDIASGKVEVIVHEAKILAESQTPPFDIEDGVDANEELKLKYRYLDLRRPEMQKALRLRSQIMLSSYRFMENNDFINIETPILAKSTPEGARDYLVPSRIYPGSFYALPQSPQLFKQLLMGAGFDRYFQIAKAFRDEDLRGDRQPEFTQMDVETSFMNQQDIIELVGRWVEHIMKDVLQVEVASETFPVLTWQKSMDHFGTDKPDLRFDRELVDLTQMMADSGFGVFEKAAANQGQVKAINVAGGAEQYSRKDIDHLTEYIQRYDAKGLAWMKFDEQCEATGPIVKFFAEDKLAELKEAMAAKAGDLLLFVADKPKVVAGALDYLRRQTAEDQGLVDSNEYRFAWIVDWPLFEYSEEDQRWISAHHPFTMPNEEDLHYLDDGEDPHQAHAQSYDLVLNGYELGSGSIRISTMDIQSKMLKALGFTPEQAEAAFGFLLEGMTYGFPPMGGIALGLDRLAMLLAGRTNIREVIAFPKNSKATEPMTQAPMSVADQQLNELGIDVKAQK